MFGNHVLRLRLHVAVKLNFRPYIRQYTSPNENFEYSYPLIIYFGPFNLQLFICLLQVSVNGLEVLCLMVDRMGEEFKPHVTTSKFSFL